jgi:hypothetical protein
MKFSLIAIAAVLAAGTAGAEGWSHAAPGMGQYEGLFESEDGTYGVNYACSGSYSQVGLKADGLHVAAGESTISVDGEVVATGNTTYNSKWDATSYTTSVEVEWGDTLKDRHNDFILALGGGHHAVWTTPSGKTFDIDLTGSGDIRNCVMD